MTDTMILGFSDLGQDELMNIDGGISAAKAFAIGYAIGEAIGELINALF